MGVLYQITEKDIIDDRKRRLTHGKSESLYSLPGIDCPYCKTSWASSWEFPFECPPRIRDEVQQFYRKNPCRPVEEWLEHVKRWKKEFPAGYKRALPKPGMNFQPVKWSRPRLSDADVYWPFLTPFVSDKLQKIFLKSRFKGASLHRVQSSEKRSPHFYNMVIDSRPVYEFIKQESEETLHCDVCGYRNHKNVKGQQKRYNELERNGWFPEGYIPKAHVFNSHVFRGIIIKPKVYEAIAHLDLRHCDVRELKIIDAER